VCGIAGYVGGGQALPVLFGPFLDKYIFGVGDPNRPGTLYWTNVLNPDAASPANTLEVSPASDPLQAGGIYDSRAYVISKERLSVIYPGIISGGFQVFATACTFGAWSKHAVVFGPKIWFLAEAGIMETTGAEPLNVTEDSWVRPLFAGATVNGYYPVDFTAAEADLRLFFKEPHLYFLYKDTQGNEQILVYHTRIRRWIHWNISGITPSTFLWHRRGSSDALLMGASDGYIYENTGFADTPGGGSAGAIACTVRTGSLDQGVSRGPKLYGDILLEADRSGVQLTVTPHLNDEVDAASSLVLSSGSGRQRMLIHVNPTSGDGSQPNQTAVGHSLALDIQWSSSTARPTLHSADISFLPEPDIRTFRPTEWDDGGLPIKKTFWGASLKIDTLGKELGLQVWADGTLQNVQTISPTFGPEQQEVSWTPFAAYQIRFVGVDGIEYILHDYTLYFEQESPTLAGWYTQWEAPVVGHDVFVYGCEFECDTTNVAKSIIFERDGGTNIDTQNITANGRTKVRVTWAGVIASTLRFRSIDSVDANLYAYRWLYYPEPPLLKRWETTESGYGANAWFHERDIFVCLRSNEAVTLTVTVDGTATNYTIASTGGARQKIRVPLKANSGVLFKKTIVSTTGCRIYNEDCVVYAKPQSGTSEYKPIPIDFEGVY